MSSKDKTDGARYLANFLQSLSTLPEFARDKIAKIKGLEKAIMREEDRRDRGWERKERQAAERSAAH